MLALGISVADAAHPTAHQAALAAPAQQTPSNGASVQSFPAITWGAVAGAANYEYQISADPGFASIILGSGTGKGTSTTYSTAAALDAAVPDGTYFWRVRAVDAKDNFGPWSPSRRIVKKWSDAPQILAPTRSSVSWPSSPLVLRWSAVPYAVSYIVTIATDRSLSNQVLGSAAQPQVTQGTVFALPSSLGPGQYYWTVTPEDAEGYRGTPSRIASVTWKWPTSTKPAVTNVNPNPQVFDPVFSWTPVRGASQYQVEVNSAQDFPAGSQWCCTNSTIGTSLSPTQDLGNATYYWRVRAVDAQGDAGAWNDGPSFTKAFDSAPPTIANLTMSDVNGNAIAGAPVVTDTPIVTWSPVPGAARYEVQIAPYSSLGCDWSKVSTDETASTAWTPLGFASSRVGPSAWPSVQSEYPSLTDSAAATALTGTYCVRVLARSDDDAKGNQVVSDWTQVGGTGNPAFTLTSQPPAGSAAPGGLVMPSGAYILPAAGSATPRTPLFTWSRVPGANGYFVVISRDAGFTQVADVGFTNIPAYAPRLANQEPLADATTSYYWAVIPTTGSEGTGIYSNPPGQDSPQTFTKSSIAPTPRAPISSVTVGAQPTFSWTPAENARNYTLEVSTSPSFGNPIDNVTTDSTAYTSTSTYPANRLLYWRVRANDWTAQGLNWSATADFRRTLPVPIPARHNLVRGWAIPVLRWSPVEGAVSYDMHVLEGNGATNDYTVNSTAFTPTLYYGVGAWRWQVRANFPTAIATDVSGGFSSLQTFVRTLPAPTGAHGVRVGTRLVISWDSDQAAKQYEVDVSTTPGFASLVDSQRIDGTTWAPNIDFTQSQNQGHLYWRVAAVDQMSDIGAFATGSF